MNALVLRAWYVDGDGNQVTIKSDVKTDLTLQECFDQSKLFVESSNQIFE